MVSASFRSLGRSISQPGVRACEFMGMAVGPKTTVNTIMLTDGLARGAPRRRPRAMEEVLAPVTSTWRLATGTLAFRVRFFRMSSDRIIIDAIKVAQDLLRQNLPPTRNLTDAATVMRFRELVRSQASSHPDIDSAQSTFATLVRRPRSYSGSARYRAFNQQRPWLADRGHLRWNLGPRDGQVQKRLPSAALSGLTLRGKFTLR